MCELAHNVVTDTRPDRTSADPSLAGYGLVAWFESDAHVKNNVFVGNAQPVGAFARSTIRPMG